MCLKLTIDVLYMWYAQLYVIFIVLFNKPSKSPMYYVTSTNINDVNCTYFCGNKLTSILNEPTAPHRPLNVKSGFNLTILDENV